MSRCLLFWTNIAVLKRRNINSNKGNMNTATFAQNLLSMQTELRRFAFKLTADHDDANDLLQETSLKALDNKEKYVAETNFKGWIYTIMRNIFINNYRKSAKERNSADITDAAFQPMLPVADGYDMPEVAYSVNEITDVINSFSPEFREPFSLYVAGYKYEEIAEKMGIPLGTVKSRIFFARKRLKKELSGYHG